MKLISIIHNSKRLYRQFSGVTIKDLMSLTPHDVEKELHRVRREVNTNVMKADYPAALDSANDYVAKISLAMGKNNVSILQSFNSISLILFLFYTTIYIQTAYASAVNNLALAQKLSGQYEDALDNYMAALEIYSSVTGTKTLSYAGRSPYLLIRLYEYQ